MSATDDAGRAGRLPLGVQALAGLTRVGRAFSIVHMDDAALARAQTSVLPDRGPVAWAAGLVLGRPRREVAISTTTCPAPDGAVPLRVYVPPAVRDGGGPVPIVVHVHGGGFALGSARQGDWIATTVAADLGAVVVSVDYRLAPTHRFPAAVEDCWAALCWAAEHARSLGADPERLGVMGDSAGGNLAAVMAIMAREEGGPTVAHQALVYPATDLTEGLRETASYVANTREIVLSNAGLEVFHGHYVPPGADARDWRLSPLHAADLSGLPPALVVVAGLDPLHDAGVGYAEALVAAGGQARVEDFHLMPHGFLSFPYLARGARPAVAAVVAAQREHLG